MTPTTSRAPSRRPARPACRSASTSSTARRGSRTTTGAAASRRRSRSSPTTSRPTPWSSRRAPSSPRRSGAASCRCPRTTTRRTSTSSPTSLLTASGFGWYEVSNWARSQDARCRHNIAYWAGTNWWGVGPGAHSHVGGVRWWNVKHPSAYAARLGSGVSPAHARETLTDEQRYDERVLLGTRLVEGCLWRPACVRAQRRRRTHRRRPRRRTVGRRSGSGRPHPPRATARRHRRPPAARRLRSIPETKDFDDPEQRHATSSSEPSPAVPDVARTWQLSWHAPGGPSTADAPSPMPGEKPSCGRCAASWSTTRTRSRGRWSPTSARAPRSRGSPRRGWW